MGGPGSYLCPEVWYADTFCGFSLGFSREQSKFFTVFGIYNLISLSYILIWEKFKTLWYEAVPACILQ